MSLNKAMVIGRIGRDPEVKTTQGGATLAKFSVATDYKAKDREPVTTWHNVVVWGRQAEIAGQFLRKGSLVYVEGRLQTDSWDDRDSGKKMYRTEIVCERFQMLDGKSDGQRGGGSSRPQQRQESRRPHPSDDLNLDFPDDSDLPF